MESLNFTYLAIVLVSILLSMTLHEAVHAFVGHWLGDDTAKLQGRLTLNPFAHIDPFATVLLPLLLALSGLPPFGAAKPVPFNPYKVRWGEYGAALVGIAGPLTNLLLAVVSGVLFRLDVLDPFLQSCLMIFTVVNVSFFIFNMIPFPPLDGSRLLYAFAPDSVRSVMEKIESMGLMAILLFMLLFYAGLAEPFTRLVDALLALLTGV